MAADGRLSFVKDYDVDDGVMPGSVTLVVQCIDNSGVGDVATLSVTIDDVNDNAPMFQNSTYPISISSATKSNTMVTTVSATYIDSGANGQLRYAIAGIGLGKEYFTVNAVGNVRLKTHMTFANDRIFDFTIFADDLGFPPLRGYTRISVTFTKTTNDVTTTATETPCYFCTLFMIIVAFLMFIGGYMIFYYCIGNPVERKMIRGFCWKCLQRIDIHQRPPQKLRVQQLQQTHVLEPRSTVPRPFLVEPTRQTAYISPFWNKNDMELSNNNPRPTGYKQTHAVPW
ncbi:hypothetical protein ScPMuIL_006455 [Solemya velum]